MEERVLKGVRVALLMGDPVDVTLPAALVGDTVLLPVEVGRSKGVLVGNCEALTPTVTVPTEERVGVAVPPPGAEGVVDPVGVLPADTLSKGVDVGDG